MPTSPRILPTGDLHIARGPGLPRGLIVPVTLADASVDKVLASATKVENQLPVGASWDGKSDLPMDESSFKQMLSDIDPNAQEDAGEPGPEQQQAAAPAPAAAGTTRLVHPKNGG